MKDLHPACWNEDDLLAHCRMTFSRASGPGGQNRNKVETSVQIEFIPACIIASASERRTQNENRKVAVQRLRCKLAVEFRPSRGASTFSNATNVSLPVIETASLLWRQYCRNGRIDVSDTNPDWPAILAEMMTVLHECEWNLSSVALKLETSSSQLVKLLKKHAPAFCAINRERQSRGHRPLE